MNRALRGRCGRDALRSVGELKEWESNAPGPPGPVPHPPRESSCRARVGLQRDVTGARHAPVGGAARTPRAPAPTAAFARGSGRCTAPAAALRQCRAAHFHLDQQRATRRPVELCRSRRVVARAARARPRGSARCGATEAKIASALFPAYFPAPPAAIPRRMRRGAGWL
eukprot:gene17410-19011_t